jgi:hypothetical protein
MCTRGVRRVDSCQCYHRVTSYRRITYDWNRFTVVHSHADIREHVAASRSELVYRDRHARQLIAVEHNSFSEVSCPTSAGTLVS